MTILGDFSIDLHYLLLPSFVEPIHRLVDTGNLRVMPTPNRS
ncbi:hypothetical protein SynA1840_00468 [Synechococcus sp. A18-40]|nr:hypothetical protein SynA1840_00468 [Synechococcus sp. A18-40]